MNQFDTSRLVQGAGDLWYGATNTSFLDAVADGTLPRDAFDRWLVQDYLFVRQVTNFAALSTSKASRDAQRVLITGLASLNDELDWFERNAEERRLNLSDPPHPVCRRYGHYMLAAAYQHPIEVLLAMFFGIEVSYCVAWGQLRSDDNGGPYAEFIDRWTNDVFVAYVKQLEAMADRYMHPQQQGQFDQVLRHETEFWKMTWQG